MRTRAAAAAALLVVAAAAGCGGSSPRVHVVRPAHPIWCPAEVKMGGRVQHPRGTFDARRVLGLSLDDAVRLGTAHRCNVRATTTDGKSLALTMDLRFDRVDVIVEHGKVARFDTHNGPVG
ncbi:hypothetical protein [Conexibacter woesei]|uniref:hypothetical protein n=1 Tax=Conexibacter woesei TaxID=191495 RepID=UPI00041BDBFF|nr:hypothetical protein [Conexibacter woesei]